MKHGTVTKIVALGVLTGMRSMAGLATLASTHRVARKVLALAAAGETVADKTPWVGDRTEPLPLAGRTIIGAGIGAMVASDHRDNLLIGAALGAATALIATHLAFYLRGRLPLSSVAGGLVEDGVVVAIASRYASRRS